MFASLGISGVNDEHNGKHDFHHGWRFRHRARLKEFGVVPHRPFYDYGTVAAENRLSKCSGRPLGLCGQRLPELNLIPIQVIDPGKATVGFIHSFGVNLYSLLF